MNPEKKLEEIVWNAVLLPDRVVKTAVDGVAELTTKAGVDRYRLAQAAIISGGAMALVGMTGYWLDEPRNVAKTLESAWNASWDLVIIPFMILPYLKRFSASSEDVKSPFELFFKASRIIRFPLLAQNITNLFGFYEGLSKIGIPGAGSNWESIMLCACLYLIDVKTNRWDNLKDWYGKFEEKSAQRKIQPGTNAFVEKYGSYDKTLKTASKAEIP